MEALASIPWGYVALALLTIGAIAASPFLLALLRSARTIAYTNSDDFRLSHANMWTEVHHADDGGSSQLMRLKDRNFVFISAGLTTVKVFVTPDRTDITSYRELKEFPLLDGPQRLLWPATTRS